ncbi:hypothetical protein [Streptomyces sp. NPDC059991]
MISSTGRLPGYSTAPGPMSHPPSRRAVVSAVVAVVVIDRRDL